MANVSQLIPNYLGGVSTAPDRELQPGQVRQAVNTYPDPTFGLKKRPGFKWIAQLGSTATYSGGHWFYYRHGISESYIGVIKGSAVYMWNVDGTVVTMTGNTGQTYLDNGKNEYDVLVRQGVIYITNKTETVAASSTNISGSITGNVASRADLPASPSDGDIYKITNTSAAEDDYYVKYVSASSAWIEWIKPGISEGLDPTTMPHKLSRTAENAFTFSTITWDTRAVGDNDSNPLPSFVGKKIQDTFFHNNRLGFLADDEVHLSRPNDFENFFITSALTQVASDPIAINCSSLEPVILRGVIPTPQGLMLFSDQEQFSLYSDSGVLTPSTAAIRSIANIPMDPNVQPVKLGSSVIFINKTPSYSRVFAMQPRGQFEPPVYSDIGKSVSEYIPDTITDLISNTQNQFVAMYDSSKRNVWWFRSYGEDNENAFRAWFNWELVGNVHFFNVDGDTIYTVTNQDGQYQLQSASLNQTPTEEIIQNDTATITVNPCLDLYATPDGSGTYDSATDTTRINLRYPLVSGLTPIVVQKTSGSNTTAGLFLEIKASGTLGSGKGYFDLVGDKTGLVTDLLTGYKYNYTVEIPKTFFMLEGEPDYTATLTISRMHFACGLTGTVEFKVTPQGETLEQTVGSVQQTNRYKLDTAPLDDERVFSVPIHQRTDNFIMKVFSDSPFPVSLNSMRWEGVYSPRYYRRA